MNDPFAIWFDLSRQTIDAQQAQVKAAQQALGAFDKAVDAQQATAKAAKANLELWKSWMNLWGIR
ncbi:hypothetical protein [Sphingomonas cavernae]|uniref:Uncharacterized protein n=1 Tax=Sphingomonas cavernae TaxID=2320861 RepID=A0A418WKF5_9SPHN|nr:hypothetical protein [Sphingomonas cavernae]RJF90531.1 hypothetical protein D3876_09885 [Sphingomonas cavernae]